MVLCADLFSQLAVETRPPSTEEALRMNFITRLCENPTYLYREAGKFASEIATCSPLAVQGVKDVLRFDRENGVKAGLEYVAQKNAAILISEAPRASPPSAVVLLRRTGTRGILAKVSEDLMEAVSAFMQKRQPEFKGKKARFL